MMPTIFSVNPEDSSWLLRVSFSSETATIDVSTNRLMLMSRSRMVCARVTICSSVSDAASGELVSTELVSNALEVHASALRRKLGRELIETVRGLGYRVDRP